MLQAAPPESSELARITIIIILFSPSVKFVLFSKKIDLNQDMRDNWIPVFTL